MCFKKTLLSTNTQNISNNVFYKHAASSQRDLVRCVSTLLSDRDSNICPPMKKTRAAPQLMLITALQRT